MVYHWWFNDYSPAAMGTHSSSNSSSSTSIPTWHCTALISSFSCILRSCSLSAQTSNLSSTWSSFSQSPYPQRDSREAWALPYFNTDACTWSSICACHSLVHVLCIWPVMFAIFHLLAWDHVSRWCCKSSIASCASASHIHSSICNRLGWQNWQWVHGDSEDGK